MGATLERFDRGFTLVEAVIVFSLTIVALLAAVVIVGNASSTADQATSLFVNEDRTRGSLARMFDVVSETSAALVDTAMRIHGPNAANDVFSDRFTIPGVMLRQCTCPTCAFHTRTDLTVFEGRFHCGWEYRAGLLGGPVARGKNWPATMTSCPLDGWPLSTAPRLDGMKFFIPRTASGQFTKAANGAPVWRGLVLLFPCVSHAGLCELRRYDVYTSDLLAGAVSYSAGWSRFPPQSPTMIDLFDFGTDGTTNGSPDGKVPLTNTLSDATSESFTVGLDQGEPTILVSKSLPTGPGPGGYPRRDLSLKINLETGATEFSVSHKDASTMQWIASCNFTRMPRTLIQGLTELAISTKVSDPHDPVANPTGLSQAGVVRVTIGTSSVARANTQWSHHVETFSLKTRN